MSNKYFRRKNMALNNGFSFATKSHLKDKLKGHKRKLWKMKKREYFNKNWKKKPNNKIFSTVLVQGKREFVESEWISWSFRTRHPWKTLAHRWWSLSRLSLNRCESLATCSAKSFCTCSSREVRYGYTYNVGLRVVIWGFHNYKQF